MSANILADSGIKLINERKYAEGIDKLTQALKERPAPLWLLERSKAYMRTNNFDGALHDAERALHVAFTRANRDLMAESQLRRAITLFRMKRYADADICAFWVIKLVDGAKASEDDGQQNKADKQGGYDVTLKEFKDEIAPRTSTKEAGLAAAMGGRSKVASIRNQATTWRIQALTAMEKLPAGDPGRKVTIVKYPDHSNAPPTTSPSPPITAKTDESRPVMTMLKDRYKKQGAELVKEESGRVVEIDEDDGKFSKTLERPSSETILQAFRAIREKKKIRTDFYQSDTTLNLSLFVKDVPRAEFMVEHNEHSIVLSPIPSRVKGPTCGKMTLRLFDKIKPEETSFTVKSMKVELVLKKATPGKWAWAVMDTDPMDDILKSADTLDARIKEMDLVFEEGSGYLSAYQVVEHEVHVTASSGRDDATKVAKEDSDEPPRGANGHQPQLREEAIPSSSATTTVDAAAAAPAPVVPKPDATEPSAPAYPTSSKTGPKNWDTLKLDDDEDGVTDDINALFQKIYKDQTPEGRRAMMKSYIESNGTSLSTNWSDVGSRTFETEPPVGAEAKNWD